MNLKISLAIVLISLSNCVLAQDKDEGATLVQTHHCYPCHEMNAALIGPPFIAIAARHGNNKELMTEVLAEKIRLGGGGTWGVVPMVPNEHVSEEDARKLAAWILNLR